MKWTHIVLFAELIIDILFIKFKIEQINQTLATRKFQMPPSYSDYNTQIEAEQQTHNEEIKNNQNQNRQSKYFQENFQSIFTKPKVQTAPQALQQQTIKMRNNSNNQTHINQHFYLKNKLHNLNEQNSKAFFEKTGSSAAQTNRFEDLYDNFAFPTSNKNHRANFTKNSELMENKRRSAHLFNL